MLFNLLESSLLVHILVFQSRNPGILNASFSIAIIASPPLLLLRGGWLQPRLWVAGKAWTLLLILFLSQLLLDKSLCVEQQTKICANMNLLGGGEERWFSAPRDSYFG